MRMRAKKSRKQKKSAFAIYVDRASKFATGMSTRTIPSTRVERRTAGMSLGRLMATNAMWLGQGAHWPPITFSLLPAAALMITGSSAAAALLIGHVSAAGNLFALLAPILAGWLSDRTRTRWGRRRPWLMAGTAVNPLDPELAIAWPVPVDVDDPAQVSVKDHGLPTLAQVLRDAPA